MSIVNMLSEGADEARLPQRTKLRVNVELMNLPREGPHTRARFLAKKKRGRSRGAWRADADAGLMTGLERISGGKGFSYEMARAKESAEVGR